jgi:pimeloyl-ACP methyl ester carboxylesterase
MPPTILFIPGAWCPPIVFNPLRDCLNSKGITSAAVALPSVDANPPTTTLDDDITHLRTKLLTLIDAGTEIILVAHSYGGVVASGAAEGLTCMNAKRMTREAAWCSSFTWLPLSCQKEST